RSRVHPLPPARKALISSNPLFKPLDHLFTRLRRAWGRCGPTHGLIASLLQRQAQLRLDLAFFFWRVHVRDFLASVAPFAGFFGEIRLVEIIFQQTDVFAFEFARDVFERRWVDGVRLRVFAGHRVDWCDRRDDLVIPAVFLDSWRVLVEGAFFGVAHAHGGRDAAGARERREHPMFFGWFEDHSD